MNASIEIQALTQEWIADPEGMPEVRREALLDAVRELMQSCVDRHNARLGTEKRVEIFPGIVLTQAFFPACRDAMAYDVADALDLDPFDRTDVLRICEEAGWPEVEPRESGPKET